MEMGFKVCNADPSHIVKVRSPVVGAGHPEAATVGVVEVGSGPLWWAGPPSHPALGQSWGAPGLVRGAHSGGSAGGPLCQRDLEQEAEVRTWMEEVKKSKIDVLDHVLTISVTVINVMDHPRTKKNNVSLLPTKQHRDMVQLCGPFLG